MCPARTRQRTANLALSFPCVWLVAAFAIGCDGAPATTPAQASNTTQVVDQAREYADGWDQLGMWLPKSDVVAHFARHLNVTQVVLEEKLADANPDVRRAAAYVIDEIGPPAKALQKALVSTLVTENDPLVRIYLCNAMREVGEASDDVLAELRKLYATEGDGKERLEQRIYVGAALSMLSQDEDEIQQCTTFVTKWLKPPAAELAAPELEQYWDLRWCAVNVVEHMSHATKAIPMLRAMQREPGKRAWVDVHVPRVLAALTGTTATKTETRATKSTASSPTPRNSTMFGNSQSWQPPANPDPSQILDEARRDTMDGRYAEALAKHIWYHENALKFGPAQYGVRLSFALMYWADLAKVYPPAQVSMLEFCEQARSNVLGGVDAYHSFHEFSSFNDTLGESQATVDLFKTLDKEQPKLAAEIYRIAKDSLILADELHLCSKYTDAKADYDDLLLKYQAGLEISKDEQFGDRHLRYAEQSFTREVAKLIALLSISGRLEEAESIAKKAAEVLQSDEFDEALQEALEGTLLAPRG